MWCKYGSLDKFQQQDNNYLSFELVVSQSQQNMECVKLVLILTAIISFTSAYLLVHDAPRKVVKILTVDNGGGWGDWHAPRFCATGTYVTGYNMKVGDIWLLQ